MNKKIIPLVIFTFLISVSSLSSITIAQPTIKIGIIGPVGLPHWEPAGMKDAAELAAKEINDAGGINIGGTRYRIELLFENEWAMDPALGGLPNPEKAVVAVTRLLEAGVRFIIGGFRTEVTAPIIETVMDWNEDPAYGPVLFFINGASTDWLIRDLTRPENYTRYKYLFRNMPINSTSLVFSFCFYMQHYLIPLKLLRMYGHPVKYAVLLEDLEWTLPMEPLLTMEPLVSRFLGPNVTLAYYTRVPATATDLSVWLTEVKKSGARLLIFVFSGPAGNPLLKQWREMEVQALPVGINVVGQLQVHWDVTEGKCEYEVLLNPYGTRTPIVPGYTEVFWDKFCAYTEAKYRGTPLARPGGYWPIYTAAGAYDSIWAIKEALEAVDSLDPEVLINYFENSERVGLTGLVRYTTSHDIYTKDFGPLWPRVGDKPYGYTRGSMVQWIAGKMEVVSPIDRPYSKKTRIPTWMYALADVDLDYNGKVDIKDVATAARAFGTTPTHPRWDIEADTNGDGIINIKDIFAIAHAFGKAAPRWPLP